MSFCMLIIPLHARQQKQLSGCNFIILGKYWTMSKPMILILPQHLIAQDYEEIPCGLNAEKKKDKDNNNSKISFFSNRTLYS